MYKLIHIQYSYSIWSTTEMRYMIQCESMSKYNTIRADKLLHRSYKSMYVEWWLHNIGYYITRPFCNNQYFKSLNERFKHVDLEEWCDYEWSN